MKLNSDTIKEVPVKRRISVSDFQISAEERAVINGVLDTGRLSEWKKVGEYETLFADYINTKYCVSVHSGISASWSYSDSKPTVDTKFFGRIDTHLCTWSDVLCPDTISLLFCLAS